MDRAVDLAVIRRRRLRWAVLGVALAVAVVAAVRLLGGLVRPSLHTDELRTAMVQRGDAEAVVSASGVVVPASETVLSSPLGGRVLRILHREGSRLEAGEPVVELDLEASRSQLGQLGEELTKLTSRRRELELGLEEQSIDLESRLELGALDVKEASLELDRQRKLGELGLVASPEVAKAEVALERARIGQHQLQRRLANARAACDAQVAALESERKIVVSKRQQLEADLAAATAAAPRAGVLTWVLPDEGATVAAGEPLARLADLGSFRVEAEVSDTYAERIAAGQRVHVRAGDATLDGTLERVLPAVDGGVLRMEVALDQPAHPALRARLRVDVEVVTERRPGALVVERGPGVSGTGPRPVWVVDGGRAYRRRAVLGLVGAKNVEVVDGLAEGETVVISETDGIRHLEWVALR